MKLSVRVWSYDLAVKGVRCGASQFEKAREISETPVDMLFMWNVSRAKGVGSSVKDCRGVYREGMSGRAPHRPHRGFKESSAHRRAQFHVKRNVLGRNACNAWDINSHEHIAIFPG